MLDNEIQAEVERLGKYSSPAKREHKKVAGLIENYQAPLSERVLHSLFEGDIESITKSLTKEVLKPKIQDLLADFFIGGIEKFIYGDDSQRSYSRSSGPSRKASYDAYYSNGKYYTPEPSRSSSSKPPKVKWDQIVMRTRPAAVELLDNIRSDIRRYKKVSITDLYDYVTDIDEALGASIDSEFPDSNYGWTNLDRVSIESVRDGFWIRFPKPVPIN